MDAPLLKDSNNNDPNNPNNPKELLPNGGGNLNLKENAIYYHQSDLLGVGIYIHTYIQVILLSKKNQIMIIIIFILDICVYINVYGDICGYVCGVKGACRSGGAGRDGERATQQITS